MYEANKNLGARLITSEKNDDAAMMLVDGVEKLPPLAKEKLSAYEWIGVIRALLSGWCGGDDEDAIINILQHLVCKQGKAKLVDSAIGKSKMAGGVDGEQWKQVKKIMRDGGVDWD